MTNRGRFVVVAVGLIGAVSVTSCGQVSRQPLASSAGGTRQPGAALTPAFTDASPFYGTPAFDYADGAAGIVAPRAHAVGTFTAAQVAGAYKTVKELLVASALDQPTLRGERPADFGGLLIKQQRTWFYAHLSQPVRPKAGPPWLTRTWVTAFAPDAALVGGVIKVTGEPMTASAIHVSGRLALQVTADSIHKIMDGRPLAWAVRSNDFSAAQRRTPVRPRASLAPQLAPLSEAGVSLSLVRSPSR